MALAVLAEWVIPLALMEQTAFSLVKLLSEAEAGHLITALRLGMVALVAAVLAGNQAEAAEHLDRALQVALAAVPHPTLAVVVVVVPGL